jgi:hypothetical protein
VTAVENNGRQITLTPALPLTDREIQRMAQSQSRWAVYEIMPIDRHDIFASLSDAELAALLPAEVLDEYLRDNQPAQPGDPDDRVRDMAIEGEPENRVYNRPLRDYQARFSQLLGEREAMLAKIRQGQADLARMQTTVELAQQDIARRQAEIAKLQVDLQRFRWEATVAERQLAAVQSQRDRLVALLNDRMEQNRRLLALLTEAQLSIAELINATP